MRINATDLTRPQSPRINWRRELRMCVLLGCGSPLIWGSLKGTQLFFSPEFSSPAYSWRLGSRQITKSVCLIPQQSDHARCLHRHLFIYFSLASSLFGVSDYSSLLSKLMIICQAVMQIDLSGIWTGYQQI